MAPNQSSWRPRSTNEIRCPITRYSSLTEETHKGQQNSVGNRSSRRQRRRRGRRLQHRPECRADGSPTRSGTMGRATLSATGQKQLVEGAMPKTRSTVAASSGTTNGPGRQADGSPTRSGTKDRKTLSGTGRKQVIEVAMSKTGSTVAAPFRTTS